MSKNKGDGGVPGPSKKYRRISSNDDDDDEEEVASEDRLSGDIRKTEKRIIKNTKKETTRIVTKTTELFDESKTEIKKVFEVVEKGNKEEKEHLEKIGNRILDKNDKQAFIIGKLNKDNENLRHQLQRAQDMISNRGIATARSGARIINIESTVGRNMEKLVRLEKGQQDLRSEIKEGQVTLRTETMDMFNKIMSAIDSIKQVQ